MRRIAQAVPLVVVLAMALPAVAQGQATRTWVSGVGDDANPCSRTAPCKTFAGAISKTAAKGEINCLDPGGFGGVTITKSLTIKCHYTEGGVLVSGTNAIVVNAAATDVVTLRGLDINGLGTGLNGIRVIQAKAVRVLDTEIYGFVRNGIDFNVSNNVAKLTVDRAHIHDNTGNGVLGDPTATGVARMNVRHSTIDENGCGVTATRFGPDPAFNFALNCGTLTSGGGGTAAINVIDNDITDSQHQGVLSNGSSAAIRIGANTITGSLGVALSAINSGQLLTFGNNSVQGNPGGNGATTGSAGGFAKRKHRS